MDRFHAGRCACIPQDVSEADVTKHRELFLYGLKPSGVVLFYLKLVNVCMKMKIIAKLRIKTYIKNETNNGKTTVYTFSRKLKNNKPKQGRTEEKQLFLLEK